MIFLLFALAFADNGLHRLSLDRAWNEWQQLYRAHSVVTAQLAQDVNYRKDQFTINYHIVNTHNKRNDTTYKLELNKFAAMSNAEFRATYNGFLPNKQSTAEEHVVSAGSNPASIDYRGKLVNPVKDQGNCGSCWAFSTVASLEGQYAKITEDLQSFSEQDLVDCVKNVKIPGSSQTCCDGCNGGLMDYGFQYMIDSQSGHDDYEREYPYTAKDGRCKFSQSKAFSDAAVTAFKDIAKGDESALEDAVATVGPISVAVDANTAWQLYSSGILKPLFCAKEHLDHGVAVVGYGPGYWIVRNSWGSTWGEEGYVRLNKGDNTCGIANAACYPVMQASN